MQKARVKIYNLLRRSEGEDKNLASSGDIANRYY